MTGQTKVHAGASITELRRIESDQGGVWHGLRASEAGFVGFGEAYFSRVGSGATKGWKCHERMQSNLIVIEGAISFLWLDARPSSVTFGQHHSLVLGPHHYYARLCLPPGLWFAFRGADHGQSTLLNIASIEHDPQECRQRALDHPDFAELRFAT